mgnify:CR=1 FL=1
MAETRASVTEMDNLLSALEAEVAELRALAAQANPRGYAVVEAKALREEITRAALTPAEFARIAGVPLVEVSDWLHDRTPAPAWALLALQLAGQLAPSVRRKLLRQPLAEPTTPTRRTHPFSQIEDL